MEDEEVDKIAGRGVVRKDEGKDGGVGKEESRTRKEKMRETEGKRRNKVEKRRQRERASKM